MNIAQAAAIAASAYNVCGPQAGEFATPATVGKFGKTTILRCMGQYAEVHDGELFTTNEILAARDVLAA